MSVGIVATEESAMYALKLAERNVESLTSVQDLLRLLAAFRVNEGFFPEEVAEAKQIFDGLARQPQHPAMAKASELSSGLLELEGLYCVDQLEALMDDFPSEEDNAPGVTFYEFLIWARRLRFMIMQEHWETFNSNANPDGMVCAVELPNIAKRLGFTLMSSVLEDLRQLHCETCGELMDFDGFLCFMDEVQRTHGFGEEETGDYEEVFHKFDHEESGELTSVQVIEVLTHLGYDIPAEEVHVLIKKVDFNGNSTMDIQEYMRLMRLLREKYISWAQRAFDKRRGSSPGLPSSSVFHVLNSLAEWPKGPMKELCANLPEVVNFETFLTLVDRCRAEGTVVSRKLAGFTDNITDPLLQIFRGPDLDAPRRFLPIGDLLWMLLECSTVKVSTKEGRDRLLQQADAARAAALDAGVGEDDLGQAGKSLGYYTFVHLIRAVVREYELRALAAEQEATQVLRLREAEIDEYRRLFASFRQDGNSNASNSNARQKSAVGFFVKETLSGLLTKVFRAQQVPQQAMLGMLKSLGQRTSVGQLEKLNTKMSTLNPNSDGCLDFATFVKVTHWLLQENQLDIHTATEKLLGSSKSLRNSFA
jgi:Ca2+-binding EF-hand superfamily protein